MAQAINIICNMPMEWAYILSSVIIIPMAFYGFKFISKFQMFTQPLWLILMITPYLFVLYKEPDILNSFLTLKGTINSGSEFSLYYFGFATGISLSLISQIGEQVDYLRFMPNLSKENRLRWWATVILAGPGWIIIGFLKQIGGIFLAALIILTGYGISHANEPIYMYMAAYNYVFEHPDIILGVSVFFVILSQVKINVTNAYAGSLAWSNFFSRLSYLHVGRVVWVVFNVAIALMLMLFGVFEVIEKVLGIYSNVAISWIGVLVADLAINKPLGLSPKIIEFKRAHLYSVNPVGIVSIVLASLISILAFTGIFGDIPKAFSAFIALSIALICTPFMAFVTKGKYYILRQDDIHKTSDSSDTYTCHSCGNEFEYGDMVYCPAIKSDICSLCCSLNSTCKDQCKTEQERAIIIKLAIYIENKTGIPAILVHQSMLFMIIYSTLSITSAFLLWIVYFVKLESLTAEMHTATIDLFYQVYYVLITFLGPVSLALLFIKRVKTKRKTRS